MPTPFPGMDPYLEHPVLWPGVHLALMVEFRKQIAPRLRPRYAVSIEERVYIALPEQHRVPDLWVQKAARSTEPQPENGGTAVLTKAGLAEPIVIETASLEVRERYLEILDLYRDQRVVTVLELVSPSNKRPGPGRTAYRQKQRATLQSECHLVEIDLLRRGRHVLAVPSAALETMPESEYLISVNRWPHRRQFELYLLHLRERLPRFRIPLAEPDKDVVLDLQAALEQVYEDGSYMQRIRYDKPCTPRLSSTDQQWADECWAAYRKAHAELFPDTTADSGRPTDA